MYLKSKLFNTGLDRSWEGGQACDTYSLEYDCSRLKMILLIV